MAEHQVSDRAVSAAVQLLEDIVELVEKFAEEWKEDMEGDPTDEQQKRLDEAFEWADERMENLGGFPLKPSNDD